VLLAPAVGGRDPAGQVPGGHVLGSALVLGVVGSLRGAWRGLHRLLGDLWFWLGPQGWEFRDLGRAWQRLLAGGLVWGIGLLWRGIAPARPDPARREVAALCL
jgi:nitric oxide reductase subunit B